MTETLTRLYDEVVVPVDFTSLGWRVLPTAEQLAARFGTPMRLLHVDTSSPWSDDEPGLLQLQARSLGRSVRVQVAPDSDVALGLARAVAGGRALVVMSSHARPGAVDLVVDSKLQRIVRAVDAPIVVCGPKARDGDAPLSRIVLCVGADLPSGELVDDVTGWARQLDLSVDILTVLSTGPEEQLDEMRAQERRLASLADAFAAHGVATSVVVLRGSRPGHEIAGYADAVPGTIVALTTHARSAPVRAVVGSVAMKVIRHAAGPVLMRRHDGKPYAPSA